MRSALLPVTVLLLLLLPIRMNAQENRQLPPQYCGGGICVDPVFPSAAPPSEMQFADAAGFTPTPIMPAKRRGLFASLAVNAKLAVLDCASSWRMRGECGLAVVAMIADAKSTKNFERYYPALREGNPIFGKDPSTLRLVLEEGALTFIELDGASYAHRNESPRAWWEMASIFPVAGIHAYAAEANEASIAQCKHEGVCR